MKLINKLNRSYFFYSFAGMAVAGVLIYFSISFVVNRQLDTKLADTSLRIENKLKKGGHIDYLSPFVEVQNIESIPDNSFYTDTTIYNQSEDEWEVYRQYVRTKTIDRQTYKIVVCESKIESEDLIATLVAVIFLTIILLTGNLMFVNRKVANQVWTPFYKNLQIIRQFSIRDHSPVKLEETNIQEFNELDQVLVQLTEKIAGDYLSLKQFSEDASHEIQTPLAIITAKLETLINDTELNEKQSEAIRSVFGSVRRLSRLNQGLLLLTKIENNQFIETKPVSFNLLIEEKLQDFQELTELKGITVKLREDEKLLPETNPVLADILINNLLANSLNHNEPNGLIQVNIRKDELEVCNSGKAPVQKPERLFSRFYKENNSSKSVGLGLAIINKICEVQNWKIDYRFEESMHCFRIQFRQKKNL